MGVGWGPLDGHFVLGYAGGPGVVTRVLQRGVQGARVREGKVRTETGQSRVKIEGTNHGTWMPLGAGDAREQILP